MAAIAARLRCGDAKLVEFLTSNTLPRGPLVGPAAVNVPSIEITVRRGDAVLWPII